MKLLALAPARSLAAFFFPHPVLVSNIFPPSEGINSEEAYFFKKNGYLVKRDVIPPDLTARAVDYTWSFFPPHFDRTNPDSIAGEVEDCLCKRDVRGRKGVVKFRERVRREKWLYNMIDGNPVIRSTVEGLIGASRTASPPYVRGLYPILPCGAGPRKRPRPHTDLHEFLVGVMAYMADVQPDGGGFHVWPGSHLVMRNHFKTSGGPGWTRDYHEQLYTYALRHPAVEIAAPAGSVVFWHHRLAHSAGLNRTNAIRHAALADYPSTDFEEIENSPVTSDPWAHWRFEVLDALVPVS